MNEIILITGPITLNKLKEIAGQRFGDMVKGVVDIEKNIIALGGDLHADEEAVLLQKGSNQENLWGVNLYPDMKFPDMVEFDSMINIRPRQNNRSRGVENEALQKQVLEVIKKLVQ
ncbi:MAG: DUF5674 family protein [Patescibacteria group bacterium]